MPEAAKCPSCGAPLSETSVIALAPVCEHCHSVITKTGGTLGLTSAYGVNDPNITRSRVEADLAVFEHYRNNYFGMLEANKEQLNWGVERYANLPHTPQLMPLVEVPPFWSNLLGGLGIGVIVTLSIAFGGFIMLAIVGLIGQIFLCVFARYCPGDDAPWQLFLMNLWTYSIFVAWVVPLAIRLFPYYKAKRANGDRPMENARRQEAYEAACAAAIRAAEPTKAAQDHRLRCQIRELDGLIETVTERAEKLRGILRNLR